MHANARLNLHGRRLLIDGSSKAARSRMSRTRWGSRVRPRTSGGAGGGAKATSVWWTARAGRTRCPTQTSRQLERRVEVLRRRKLGPARIAGIVEMPALDGASGACAARG